VFAATAATHALLVRLSVLSLQIAANSSAVGLSSVQPVTPQVRAPYRLSAGHTPKIAECVVFGAFVGDFVGESESASNSDMSTHDRSAVAWRVTLPWKSLHWPP
jgi:hypothetical protein